MMTREDVMRMAKEADRGFEGAEDADGTMPDSIVGIESVERFANACFAAGAAAEREAITTKLIDIGALADGEFIAAIRARGEK